MQLAEDAPSTPRGKHETIWATVTPCFPPMAYAYLEFLIEKSSTHDMKEPNPSDLLIILH